MASRPPRSYGLVRVHVVALNERPGALFILWSPEAYEQYRTSGHVLDVSGQVFRFWTAWDAERNRPAFKTWKLATPNPRWERIGEYQRARTSLDLP